MYTLQDAVKRNLALSEENDKLRDDLKRFVAINDSLIEDNEVLQKEIAQMCKRDAAYVNDNESLRAKLKHVESLFSVAKAENERLKAELAEERDRHDRLSDFELAQAKELREAKLYFNLAMEYLAETGYNTDKLEKIVAIKRVLMKLEEENE